MDIVKEIACLQRMTVPQLRARYAEVFKEVTKSGHKEFLIRKIAWRLQSQAEGDLTERAKRRAMELASDLDIRTRAPSQKTLAAAPERTHMGTLDTSGDERLPMPGTVLTRDYKGRTLRVTILSEGFDFDGRHFRSLSAIAKEVTGSHWNGFNFFGLTKDRRGA